MYNPNRKLYMSLLAGFILATCLSLVAFSGTSKWYTVVVSIGCGGISSVVVAWLIDIADCKARNEKQKRIASFMLNDLQVSICKYLETFCDLCVDAEDGLKLYHHTFEEWLEIYVGMVRSGTPVRKLWIIDAIEGVERAYRAFEDNVFWLIDGEIISVVDYKKIKLIYKIILGSKIYYLMSEKEPSPDIIEEENKIIATQLKLYEPFSKLPSKSFSSGELLSEMENRVNEMDYLL